MRSNRGPILAPVRSVLVRADEANRPPPGVMAARRALGWPEETVVVVHQDPTDPRVPIATTETTSEGLPRWTVAHVNGRNDQGPENAAGSGHMDGPSHRPARTDRSVAWDVLGEPWEILSDGEGTASGSGLTIPPAMTVNPGTPCPGTPGIDRRRHLAPPTPSQSNKRMKGSLAAALQFTQSAEMKEKAQNEYMDAIYAQQTVSSKTAIRQTWSRLSQSLGYEPVPITAAQVREVSAALKAAGYRSAMAYINEAFQWHKRKGYPVSDVLHMAMRDAKRAVTRAIGPPRRAPEVPLEWLAFLREKGPRDAGSPTWPADRYEVWVFATRFILREQELACIYMKEVDLNPRLLQVTLNLPATKNDPSGRGARRTLGCICKSSPEEKSTCPYCTALHLVQRQGHRLMTTASSTEVVDAPLIGQQRDPMLVVEKAAMIEAFKHDARRLSLALPEANALATNEVSGHTFRRSGVKDLARKNTPLPLIQFFARHSSSAVLAYVEEAYEESPDGNLQVLNHLEMRDQIAALSAKTNDMAMAYDQLKTEYEELAEKCNMPLDRTAILKMFTQWSHPEIVVNLVTGKLHSTMGNCFRNHPNEWVTACGWPWIAAGRVAKAIMEPADLPQNMQTTACERRKEKLPNWARPDIVD